MTDDGTSPEVGLPRRRGGEPRRFNIAEYELARQGSLFGDCATVELIDGIFVDTKTGQPWQRDRKAYYHAVKIGTLKEGERSELLAWRVVRKPQRTRPHVVSVRCA